MEAMFDRMDAIGKGVLGLTIQCAQCHNHKFDPLTQEEYYRLFAFLNNDHEAQPRRLHARRADASGPRSSAQIARDRGRARSTDARLGRADGRVGGAGRARPAASGRSCRPEVDDISTGGQQATCLDDGSILAQGYAPTKHTVEVDGDDRLRRDHRLPPRAAERSRTCRCGGPGRSIKGTCALTEFEVEAAPGRRAPDKASRGQDRRGHAPTSNPPETPLEPIFDDKTGNAARHRPGRLRHRRQGRDRLGHRRRPRPPQPAAQGGLRRRRSRSSIAGGTVLTFYLKQNHGGWNSDDNQNNNLGRFRLSRHRPRRGRRRRPAARRACAQILAIPRGRAHARADSRPSSATGGPPCPSGRTPTTQIEALWQQHPEGSTAAGARRARDEPRETHVLKRGDFLKPAQAGRRRRARVPAPAAAGRARRPADASPTGWSTAARRRRPASIVNRVWQAYFGTASSAPARTSASRAKRPSHPELLDWLAVEFMDQRLEPEGRCTG